MKRLIAIAFVLAAAANSMAAGNSDIWRRRPQVVAAWDFSGGRTTSPTGHSGTLTNGATVPARYISLDGVDDHLSVADSDSFSFVDGASDKPFAVECWVNLTSASDAYRTAVSKLTTTGSQLEWQLLASSNSVSFKGASLVLYHANGSASIQRCQVSKTITAGTWFHLVGVYSGNKSDSGISVWINGARVDDSSASSGTYTGMTNGTSPMRIGLHTLTSNAFGGQVAGIMIYNRAPSASEIISRYNSGMARQANGGTP